MLGETPEETLQGGRGCTEEGMGERRRKGSHVVRQKAAISHFWIYRGLDLAKHMLNQINTINIYELSSSN